MEGQGRVIARYPPPSLITRPLSSRTSAVTPGNAQVADPGRVAVIPGRGVIMIIPVSVCHQVSTIGQRPPPTCVRYQTHASGLIGSPTEPRSLSDDRSCLSGHSIPQRMKDRMAVGAV